MTGKYENGTRIFAWLLLEVAMDIELIIPGCCLDLNPQCYRLEDESPRFWEEIRHDGVQHQQRSEVIIDRTSLGVLAKDAIGFSGIPAYIQGLPPIHQGGPDVG